MILFHISPCKIDVLDPECSTGKLKVIWLVTRARLAWAVTHVSCKKNSTRLFLHMVRVSRRSVQRRWRCVYVSYTPIKVQSIWRVRFVF